MVNETTGEIILKTDENSLTRERLAFRIVLMEAMIMLVLLVTIIVVEYLINIDINRHNN